MIWLLAIASLGDVSVSCSREIESDRPIAALCVECIGGLIHDITTESGDLEKVWGGVRPRQLAGRGRRDSGPAILIDGEPGTIAGALAGVAGFVAWDAPGSVEYAYTITVGDSTVSRWARISDGRISTTARVVGGLGDRVRSVTIDVESEEHDQGTTIVSVGVCAEIACGRIGRRLVSAIARRRLAAEADRLVAEATAVVHVGRERIESLVGRLVK